MGVGVDSVRGWSARRRTNLARSDTGSRNKRTSQADFLGTAVYGAGSTALVARGCAVAALPGRLLQPEPSQSSSIGCRWRHAGQRALPPLDMKCCTVWPAHRAAFNDSEVMASGQAFSAHFYGGRARLRTYFLSRFEASNIPLVSALAVASDARCQQACA